MTWVIVVPVLILSTVRLYCMMMPFGIEGDNQVNVILTVDGAEEKISGAFSGTIIITWTDNDNWILNTCTKSCYMQCL